MRESRKSCGGVVSRCSSRSNSSGGSSYVKQASGTRNAPVRNIMTAACSTEENIFFAAHDLFSLAHADLLAISTTDDPRQNPIL